MQLVAYGARDIYLTGNPEDGGWLYGSEHGEKRNPHCSLQYAFLEGKKGELEKMLDPRLIRSFHEIYDRKLNASIGLKRIPQSSSFIMGPHEGPTGPHEGPTGPHDIIIENWTIDAYNTERNSKYIGKKWEKKMLNIIEQNLIKYINYLVDSQIERDFRIRSDHYKNTFFENLV